MVQRKPLRVLVADPDRTNREHICRELELAGHTGEAVADGAEAIVHLEADPPDVLVLDVHLPDMDGFELCEQVRHETRDTGLIVIIMTEATDELTRAYLGPMVDFVGGDYYFSKPCDPKLLVTLLDDLAAAERVEARRARKGFPTQVVWPTTRSTVAATAGIA